MKLYHATPIDNKDNVIRCGLQSGFSTKFKHLLSGSGVYGFTQLEDALGFAKDQCWSHGVVVFSFDAVSPLLDPEYDDPDYGVAYFFPTDESVNVVLECEIEY